MLPANSRERVTGLPATQWHGCRDGWGPASMMRRELYRRMRWPTTRLWISSSKSVRPYLYIQHFILVAVSYRPRQAVTKTRLPTLTPGRGVLERATACWEV